MIKEWFIKIDGKEEGPFSLRDLRKDSRVSMQTLARHKDKSQWLPVWEIPQIRKELEGRRSKPPKSEERFDSEVEADGEIVIAAGGGLGPWQWMVVVAILILLIAFYAIKNA